MLDSLVDAHRIGIGERLALRLEPCDLGLIARAVVAELRAVHGDRFAVDAGRDVHGIWSAHQLRRAIWNLATNGVDHGADDAPVLVLVRRGSHGDAEVLVQNEGPPIAAGELRRLFTPFDRPRARSGTCHPGCGLGLTLVWACAEAHGGRVTVESDARCTTFTMSIPCDARPYVD
jgi:signal transduction histidine kinase